jgi:DNA-binding NarL/FixJ family response regulator
VEDGVRVHLVVEHQTIRELLVDLLTREHCVVASTTSGGQPVAELEVHDGDVVVVDEAVFSRPGWSREIVLDAEPSVVVVATENDPFSRVAALAGGARGWIPRERLGDDLADELRRVAGRSGRLVD